MIRSHPQFSTLQDLRPAAALAFATLLATLPAAAMAQAGTVYRCPGPPVLYTDALSAEEARNRGCRTVEGAPITVIQATKPRPVASGAAPGAAPPAASRSGDAKVDPSAQRQRDSDARRILEGELKREEDRLAELRREYNNGEPERLGSERNYARYLERVSSLKDSIQRSEADVAAIKRELAKLKPD